MFQRKPRRFKRRMNGRNNMLHNSSQTRLRSNSFNNGQLRNNFRQTLSAEKLFEKYSSLAKEAMSSGDKTLSENYLQHADHFIRIIEDKNRNRSQNNFSEVEKSKEDQKKTSDIVNTIQTEENKNKD